MAATYGCDLPRIERTDYERFVALWACRDRQTIRAADCVRLGIGATFGGQLTLAWWESVTDNLADAVAQMNEHNAALAAAMQNQNQHQQANLIVPR